jgi:hypothetical protein
VSYLWSNERGRVIAGDTRDVVDQKHNTGGVIPAIVHTGVHRRGM